MASQNVGQVELDLLLNSKGFKRQLEGAVNRAVSQTSTSMSGKVSSSFAKMGKLAVAAFSVKAIVGFTKSSIELGSALQEVQNVVDTTFTTLNKDVNDFAKNAIKSYGLSEKVTKQYMGTLGAMSKSFGFSEAEAFDMSKTLTGLAGDVSSFYNISSDEAFTKLKAVFTGETEALKDLGVVMTQTALDEYALKKGFGKTTAAMTEQEKVALRYAFVQEQLKTASGDFIRTQDGWANQMRVLSLQWDSLKANLGQAFITLLTPVLKMLNEFIELLVIASDKFNQFIQNVFGKKENNTADAMKDTADSAGNVESNLQGAEKAAKAMNKTLLGIDQLNRLNAKGTTGALTGGGTSTGSTGAAEEATKQASNSLDLFSGKFEKFKTEAVEWLTILGEGPGRFCVNFGTDLYNYLTKPFIDNKDKLKETGDLMLEDFGDLNDQYQTIYGDTWDSMNKIYGESIAPLLDRMSEHTSEAFGKVLDYYNTDIAPIFDDFNEDVSATWDEHGKPMLEEAEDLCRSLRDAVLLLWDNALKPMLDMLLKVELVKLKVGLFALTTTFNSLLGSALDFSSGIMRALRGVIDFITGALTLDWTKAWQGIKDIFGGMMDSMVSIFAAPINAIISMINGLIDKINSVKVPDWMPFIGGKQMNMGHIPTIQAPHWGEAPEIMMPDNITHYAQGGYVRPNTPQLAVVGDNRHQGEIIAPENKLAAAVAAGNADMMNLLMQLINKLGNTGNGGSQPIVNQIVLDGDMIYEQIMDEADRRSVRSGG